MKEYTIKIDPSFIPDGWEPVEFHLKDKGSQTFSAGGYTREGSLKLRKAWTPPAFLKSGWIAMESNGSWYWYESEPCIEPGGQFWTGPGSTPLRPFYFMPPPCIDWLKSKRRIPAFQEPTA